jgi:glycosyltransferase involved in cell wall biosynthesis
MPVSPPVTVLMPAYNAERYLGEAIDSILAQTLTEFEFLILDDGSTDQTPTILREYAQRDSRIRVLTLRHAGYTAALNAGITYSRGNLIARMDADDRALPDRLEQQVAYLREHPQCVALGGQVLVIDPDGRPICPIAVPLEHDEIDRWHLAGVSGIMFHPACTIRKDVLLAVGQYRLAYEPAEDFDLLLRLAEVGRLANVPMRVLEYRVHPRSTGHTRAAEQTQQLLAALKDAYTRRGLPSETARLPDLPPRRSVADFHREWALVAARNGYRATARKHARSAFALEPSERETWRALAHSILPRPIVGWLGSLRAHSRALGRAVRGSGRYG